MHGKIEAEASAGRYGEFAEVGQGDGEFVGRDLALVIPNDSSAGAVEGRAIGADVEHADWLGVGSF